MEEHFIHIRPQKTKVWVPHKKKHIVRHPDARGATLAYQIWPEDQDGKWAALGVCFSPPTAPYWNRKKTVHISRVRLRTSPVRLQFEGLNKPDWFRQPGFLLSAFRTVLIEQPEWEYVDDQVLRPGRFTSRYGAKLMGPDGSLMTVYFDFKTLNRGVPRDYAQIPRPLDHWIMHVPSWAPALLEG